MQFILSVLLPTRGTIRFSGGIILRFVPAAAVVSSEAMAEHLRPPTTLYPTRAASSSSNVFSQRFEAENVLEEEDRVLCLLLEAFPGLAHETLAIAYARADRDPNKTAEILSEETVMNSIGPAQSSDSFEIWEPPNHNPENLLLEEQFGLFTGNRPNHFNSDDFSSKEGATHQLKNAHSDFPGASIWQDSSVPTNHARPPDRGAQSLVALGHSMKPNSPEEEHSRIVGFPTLRRQNETRSSKQNWGTRRSSAPSKPSAINGSVPNRMQPSAVANGTRFSEVTNHEEGEHDDGGYSEMMVKQKNDVEDGAAEDFLHSMLGGDFEIDLVRDVLAYYEGDTGKALETLLNIGSTSSGIDYSRVAVDAVDPSFSTLSIGGEQNADNGEIRQTSGVFLEGTDQEALVGEEEEGQAHRVLLVLLCHEFPTVEQSFLAQVLEAAEFSYEGALEILKESGMTPVGEQNIKPKVDPNEIFQALFRTKNDPPAVGGPFDEPLEQPLVTTDEPWSLVAPKPRTTRKPDMQAQKMRSDGNGELDAYNEYHRQRASANEHWETMKMYMKDANTAYNWGDRAQARMLSEKGAKFKELARAASHRASQNIFNVRNKNLSNNITIDLHSQHVAEALSLLQLHLRTLLQIPSVNGLTVITGQGSHSAGGQAKIKPAVTSYLDKKQIAWTQESPGCIVVKMSDVRINANWRDAESYSISE